MGDEISTLMSNNKNKVILIRLRHNRTLILIFINFLNFQTKYIFDFMGKISINL